MKKLIKNAAKCNVCGEIIESKHVHDFKWCSCGNIAVDGGLEYAKRCFKTDNYTELSEHKEKEEKRILEVSEEELYIIQEALDFLYSHSYEHPSLDYEVFSTMMNDLYYKEFEELEKVY